jgi:2-iminobutanoate/2-iminopropanoate deaminase
VIKKIETDNAPAAIGPYSQAVKAGDFVYCSGQIPLVPGTANLVEGGVAEQTVQVMENLKQVLFEARTDFNSVVKTTIYLADMNDFATVNEQYSAYFGAIAPARATVQVAALPKDALVEIDAVAYIG